MKLNTNSWHYRMWESSFDSYRNVPVQTDLCHYCHRVFWQLVLRAFFGFMIAAAAGMVGFLLYMLIVPGLYHHTVPTLIGMVIVAVVIGAGYLYVRWLNSKKASEPKTLVGKWLESRKQRICPVVEFE